MSQKNWNNIKARGQAYALQCTVAARKAGLVDDSVEPAETSDVYVAAVGDLILVFDENVDIRDRTSIITSAASEIEHLGAAGFSKVQAEGNGYQVNLPRDVVESSTLDLDATMTHSTRTAGTGEDVIPTQFLLIAPKHSEDRKHIDSIHQYRQAQVDNPRDDANQDDEDEG